MFFDNASTTKVDKEIISQLDTINDNYYYNPSATYSQGMKCRDFIDKCRANIKKNIGASNNASFVFTGSATEANNLAIMGSIKKNTRKILVSMGEHPSVYNAALNAKNNGYRVEFIKLDKDGKVDIEDFTNKLSDGTVDFVSVIHISNETGVINDIRKLVELSRSYNPKVIFHSDGVQAVGKIEVDMEYLDVDMYTISAHKIHGLKGVGGLYIKKGIHLKPLIVGGGQEDGVRSGTENVLGIFSLSKALEIYTKNSTKIYDYVLSLRQAFLKSLSVSKLNYSIHDGQKNLPHIISISFDGCRAETILNLLSDQGIFVGSGSACSSKNSGNRILEAMGVKREEVESNLRISFSKYNTLVEVEKLSEIIEKTIKEYLKKVNKF